MKINAVLSIFLAGLMCSTASAENDWVHRFLERYQPFQAPAPAPPSQIPATNSITQGSLAAMVQNGAISLTTEDIVRLMLENNRDVIVKRLAPVSSVYAITSLYRPFEPNFQVIGTVNRANTPSRSQLTGAASLAQLTHDYRVGIDQTLQTGTIYSVDFDLNRSSSNSSFNLFNPSYNGVITYSFTQHLLRDFGRLTNSHQIRIARNTEKISEIQFELQIIDLITQAQQAYWDLRFSDEDIKVKKR